MLPLAARAQLSVSVNIAPPELPVYEQPPLPAPGYLWVPGYWAYGPDGYFWVPGTWVEPPAPDLVWTPGYWSFSNGAYLWTAGYWGPTVGFYGGINYGYGYPGRGYYGGEWRNHQFFYNSAVDNVRTVNVTNVYSKTVVNDVTVNRVSYNGGPGGVSARPTAEQEAAARAPHHGPTSAQTQHVETARGQRDLLASVNHGAPPVAATPKPNSFSGSGVVKARGAESHATAAAGHAAPPPPAAHNAPPRANEAPRPNERPAQQPPQHPMHLAQAPEAPRPEAARPPPRAEAARPPSRPEATPHATRPEAQRPSAQDHESRASTAERPQAEHREPSHPQSQQRPGENTARHEPARKPEEHRGG